MSEKDKLRYILDKKSWSQERLAKEFGISRKTVGAWLSGKVLPRGYNGRKIDDMYIEIQQNVAQSNKKLHKNNTKGNKRLHKGNKSNIDLTERTLKGILYEAQGNKHLDEGDKDNTEKYREYYNAKVIALTLEEKNDSRVILFPSVSGEEGEWYKMGGNSALFYKYYLGPRMGRKPEIRHDSDMRHRFKYGVSIIHWINTFMTKAEELGLEVHKGEFGIVAVELGHKYSEKEILELKNLEKSSKEKIIHVVMPKRSIPDLYGLIRQLAQILPSKIKRMDAAYRETFGRMILDDVARLYRTYYRLANGNLDVEVAKSEFDCKLDDLTAMIAVASEAKLLDLTTLTRVGDILVDLRMTMKRRINENIKN